LRLPIGDLAPDVVNVVVEIPTGSVNKYEWDTKLKVFKLDRNLHSPVHYPGDYGFIASTLGEDGDPLDAVVLVDAPSFTGCVMAARPIGMLQMVDQGIPDQKILAVPLNNPRYREVTEYAQIYPHILREMEHFFSVYKDLEGKRTKAAGWGSRAEAYEEIRKSQDRFRGAEKQTLTTD